MGETGPRRSTLVSRLPIFRRSVSKRQDSLPSSPSSGGVANGVHTSSPSSTNSSSSSTGKRRSLFRTATISFHAKRNSEPRADPTQLSQDNGSQNSEPSLHRAEDGTRAKTRHSFGFGGHRHKKITRSQTEDFEKVSNNRSLFNCISSGTNEGDDSGFLDDYSSKRSSKHKKQLLPKSFSSNHRFSRHSSGTPTESHSLEVGTPRLLTPGSCPSESGDGSLQSPIVSEDRTTAITPSEFVPVTEDSVSEVDALPAPSPIVAPPETVNHVVSTLPVLPDASTVSTECETAVRLDSPVKCSAQEEPSVVPLDQTQDIVLNSVKTEDSGREEKPNEEKQRHAATLPHEMRKGRCCVKSECRPSHLRKPHTVSVGSSVSPYHEVMRMERRWRSASEGAGGPRLHLNLKEPHCNEGHALLQHRTSSSSSKLGSLDVLNNLGSSELDEDDLMLDLDLSDDQRRVSRENSSQSIASCLALLQSPIEPAAERTLGKEAKASEPSMREPVRPTSLLPADWCLPRDEELVGLEGLPFRLMLQDCTAVKTLLLRLRRMLQESTDTSPASSLHSLPISPCSDKSLPFKDPGRDENASLLLLQLKDKDELIQRLQAELDKARATQKLAGQRADKSTQTEHTSTEVSSPSRAISQSVPTRDRRLARSLPASATGTSNDVRKFPSPVWYSAASRDPTVGEPVIGPRKVLEVPPPSQIPRAVTGSSSSLSSDSERGPRSFPTVPSSSSSCFTGRLGQPPRGPLSLHMYSRKNVFLQHSLHTAELQALAQHDS